MKFLCDRCKTRYSIADERVRGKILKIRCKNCANVITVREGMTDAEADPGTRRRRTTTMAPVATVGAEAVAPVAAPAAAPSALGAAFQSALAAKPPAALEEEWYVSMDGAQEGPFSLADAQRWVSSKPYDAELHCWSEGFDDWLPVDKVSHFRGLRKKPVPAPPVAPPPLPRASARMAAPAAPELEDEPKPLFAATMASLERGLASSSGLGLHPVGRPSATPPGGVSANGAAVTASASASARPLPAFDASDGATQIESPAFPDEASAPAAPAPSPAGSMPGLASAVSASSLPAIAPAAAPSPPPALDDDNDDNDDDLSIGEVSRVVNLADLMRSRPSAPTRSSGPIAALPRPSAPRLGTVSGAGSGSMPRLDGAAATDAAAQDAVSIPPPVATTHRRGLLLLLGAAVVLLAAVVIAVVVFATGDDHVTTTSLARGDLIDTSRPDDPLFRPATPEPTTPDKPADTGTTTKPSTSTSTSTTKPRTPTTTTPTRPDVAETPTGASLRSDEIEEIARKNSTGTQRCYMRSQKGADAILIGEVKKIQATLDIAPDGTVRDVTLSEHADNTLGKCLISTIKAWKFRASPGGLYKISLQFG